MTKTKHSLIFYGVAISSVLVLFNLISAYGNSQLKAQKKITGSYIIDSENLPNCLLEDKDLVLNLEQSGIYLFGNIGKIPVDGKIVNQEILLSGNANKVKDCHNELMNLVTIKAIPNDKIISGTINWDSTHSQFTAELQESSETTTIEH